MVTVPPLNVVLVTPEELMSTEAASISARMSTLSAVTNRSPVTRFVVVWNVTESSLPARIVRLASKELSRLLIRIVSTPTGVPALVSANRDRIRRVEEEYRLTECRINERIIVAGDTIIGE